MEKNKYYTPNEDEFHVGFEYEEFMPKITHLFGKKLDEIESDYLNDRKEDKWVPRIFTKNHSVGLLSLTQTRVRFLYDTDIEGEGWCRIDYDTYELSIGEILYCLEFNPEIKTYIYRKKPHTSDSILFSGNIRNRSELRKLMKQLNIK